MVVLVLSACSPEGGVGASRSELVITDRCEISGLGLLPTGDFFAGDARGGDTGASGSWTHVGDSRVAFGTPEWILCRINGATLGDFGGPATFDGAGGYTFRVHVQDFGDPRPPDWVEGTPEVQTIGATRWYRPSRWEDGAVSIDERAIVTIPSELPVTVGGASNQWAWLTFQRSETFERVVCRYRGDDGPHCRDGSTGGARYVLERCTGDDEGEHDGDVSSGSVGAGDRVDVASMTLHVQSGDHSLPSRWSAQTTVTVDLEVTPLIRHDATRDYYRFAVWDDATGEQIYLREGALATGNLRVDQLF